MHDITNHTKLQRPGRLARLFVLGNLLVIAVLFVLAVLSYQIYAMSSSTAVRFVCRRLFHDAEMSIPTLYNFALIIFNCCVAAIIALKTKVSGAGGTVYWLGLSLTFFLMSFDEAAQMHERLIEPMQNVLPDSPFLTFAWTPIGASVVLVFALLYLPFVRSLPKSVAVKMILAGVVFSAGALGFETLGDWIAFYFERASAYHLTAGFEESLEMLGMVVFGSALLEYLRVDEFDLAAAWPDVPDDEAERRR